MKMNKHNSEALFIECLNTHKNDFYRLAFSYVKNQEDALDIVQESIQKALVSLQTVKNTNSIKNWFYKIVVRTSIDFLRKQKKVTFADEKTIDFLSRGTIDSYEDMDLSKALDGLPIQYKTVIILRFFEDLKLDEIADVLDENINTVKTRLYKGLKLLRLTFTQEEIING